MPHVVDDIFNDLLILLAIDKILSVHSFVVHLHKLEYTCHLTTYFHSLEVMLDKSFRPSINYVFTYPFSSGIYRHTQYQYHYYIKTVRYITMNDYQCWYAELDHSH